MIVTSWQYAVQIHFYYHYYSSLQADSEVKFASLAYEFAATWRWSTFAQMTQSELSHIAVAV